MDQIVLKAVSNMCSVAISLSDILAKSIQVWEHQ